jgi:integrase
MAERVERKRSVPNYGTHVIHGHSYYRTRIKDINGKVRPLYASTPEELYKKEKELRDEIEDELFRRENPTVREYSEKWLEMQSPRLSYATMKGYQNAIKNYIVKPLGDMYMSDVRLDDLRVAMVPISQMSSKTYDHVNMLIKQIFKSALRSGFIDYDPSEELPARGGVPVKPRQALTDEQVKTLLASIKETPVYLFILIGLYAGLRREEILGLQWDCVFLDAETPYISVRRAWRSVQNRPEVTEKLKSKAARRDIPIPKILQKPLQKEKELGKGNYVITSKEGDGPISYSQYSRIWNYVKVRSTLERRCYKYVNGQAIRTTIKHEKGESASNNHSIRCNIDFYVSPHMLRHTYITNLIYAGVDPKTVQYLAGHDNSKTTMDIYAKVKYNDPRKLSSVVKEALDRKSLDNTDSQKK